MMGKKSTSTGLDSLLGVGVDCEGNASVEGTLRLDGSYRGRLSVGETLIIGSTGSFEGRAVAKEVVVAGTFKGEVLGTERVELQKGARLEGDVLTRSFVVEPGVFFEGNCRMEFSEADEERLRNAAETTAGDDDDGSAPVVRSLSK